MDEVDEVKEVDFGVSVEETLNFTPVLTFMLIAALIFVAIIMWGAVNFHKADAGTKQWHIWSDRCEQITELNADRLRSDKDPTYFEGCPEGPHNEVVAHN